MIRKRKGFTLVEVIVVLVILAILAAVMIPSMTGWIDKTRERQLIVACRTCVNAAQTLASESYGVDGTSSAPESDAVVALAGVNGVASNISLDTATAAVNTLTYNENDKYVTYLRLPSPQYVFDSGIIGITNSVWSWAQEFRYNPSYPHREQLTINYSDQKPTALTDAQITQIFGNLVPAVDTQYIYPMSIFDTAGNLLNIQYVTAQDPASRNPPVSGPNRYVPTAFIIDGRTYVSTLRSGNEVAGRWNVGSNFQQIMNGQTFATTQEFVDKITNNNYYAEVK